MVAPLVPLAIGGLALSGMSNIYRGVNSARVYRQFARGYKNLDTGYRNYLARNGRKINPDRGITSYYGQYIRNRSQAQNSFMGAMGSAGGSLGAGSLMTSRWL